jgi:hypothetical protein
MGDRNRDGEYRRRLSVARRQLMLKEEQTCTTDRGRKTISPALHEWHNTPEMLSIASLLSDSLKCAATMALHHATLPFINSN